VTVLWRHVQRSSGSHLHAPVYIASIALCAYDIHSYRQYTSTFIYDFLTQHPCKGCKHYCIMHVVLLAPLCVVFICHTLYVCTLTATDSITMYCRSFLSSIGRASLMMLLLRCVMVCRTTRATTFQSIKEWMSQCIFCFDTS
jgi:hypothetical protein